jgi:hypothetical protein
MWEPGLTFKANSHDSDWSDGVAWFGGKISDALAGQADNNTTSDAHHYDFDRMFNEIDGDRLIDDSYSHKR